MNKRQGSCPCGAVRFEVTSGHGHAHPADHSRWGVRPDQLRLLAGEPYEWRVNASLRFFCLDCSVLCYSRTHVEALGGDRITINAALFTTTAPVVVEASRPPQRPSTVALRIAS